MGRRGGARRLQRGASKREQAAPRRCLTLKRRASGRIGEADGPSLTDRQEEPNTVSDTCTKTLRVMGHSLSVHALSNRQQTSLRRLRENREHVHLGEMQKLAVFSPNRCHLDLPFPVQSVHSSLPLGDAVLTVNSAAFCSRQNRNND